MRNYQINERSLFLDHKFLISDDNNNVIYTVFSKLFEFGDAFTLIDKSGDVLIKICQKKSHIHSTYHIYADEDEEQHLAIMQRTRLPWHHKFKIKSVYGDYIIDRTNGIFSDEYILIKNKKIIAKITRKCLESIESYSIKINETVDKKDDLFLLTLAVVLWCAQRIHYFG